MATFLNLSAGNNYNLAINSDDNNWYLTGLTDSDGGFSINLPKPNESRLAPRFIFQISSVDQDLVDHLIQTYDSQKTFSAIVSQERNETRNFKGFTPRTYKSYSFIYRKQESIANFVIPHFVKYPLQTYKSVDFLIFCKAFDLYAANIQPNIKTSEKILVLVAYCAYALNTQGQQRSYPEFDIYCNQKGLNTAPYQKEIDELNNYFDSIKKNYQDFYGTLTTSLSYEPCYSYFVGFTQGDGGLSASLGTRFRWQMNINDREPFVIKRCVATLNSQAKVFPKKQQNSYVTNIMLSEHRLSFLFKVVFTTTTWQGKKASILGFAKEYLKIMETTSKGSDTRAKALAELEAKIRA